MWQSLASGTPSSQQQQMSAGVSPVMSSPAMDSAGHARCASSSSGTVGLGLGLGLGLDAAIEDGQDAEQHEDNFNDADEAASSVRKPLAPVTPSAHPQVMILSRKAKSAGATAATPASAARAWVSPRGTMRMITIGSSGTPAPRAWKAREAPHGLAGPGAEDSPALVQAQLRKAPTEINRQAATAVGDDSFDSAENHSGMELDLLSATPAAAAAARRATTANANQEDDVKAQHTHDTTDAAELPPNDSGVFFDELDASKELAIRSSRRGSAHRRAASDASDDDDDEGKEAGEVSEAQSSAFLLQEEMGRMSFLDRVMQHKASPLRLRREAKAKERAQREWQEVSSI